METYESLLAAVTVPESEGRPVIDPATEEVIGHAPVQTVDDLEVAVEAAKRAQPAWEALGHAERSRIMLEAAEALDRSAEALAQLVAHEQGKPLDGPGARFEAGGCAVWMRTAATTPLEPETVVDDDSGHAVLNYRAIGIVGAINPWNWPALIAMWQLAPSLRMGNAVVMKPASDTTLSVLAMAAIVNQVLPEGVFTVVAGGGEVGAAITKHPAFGKIMFTGSTPTGKSIARDASDNLARLTLELGGNDAGIVLPDADPKAIAEGLFWGAFINTGQTCAALKRLYVHDSIHDEVVAELVAFAKNVPMGPGYEAGNLLGPLTNRGQWNIVNDLVEKAKADGATIALGGNPDADAPGYFYPATIVTDVTDESELVSEEQFGPALPVLRYTDLDDVIARANAVDVGLGGSVWSSDVASAREVAARVQSGTVWINQHGTLHPLVPFGGIKSSGYGLEFGVEGLKAVAVPQVISG